MSSIEHARHNESVCNYLGKKEIYSDWVITTAFYSSMHYVRHLIIPITKNGKEYSDFESLFCDLKSPMEGRHGFLRNYVLMNYSSIGYEYCKLHDMSTTARYTQYVYTRNQAKVAKSYLEKIKNLVNTTKPED